MLFFWARPYWRYCVQSIWRFYWALCLDLHPSSPDLATVGSLYFRENDFLEAARKLAEHLKKDWPIDEEAISLEKFPFKPDQTIEPETLRFLRLASADLVDLARAKNLPSVCLGHGKVFWSQCPVCAELEKKARENAS